MDTLPPFLFLHLDHGVRAHPGAKRAADTFFLIGAGNGMVALGIDFLAERENLLRAYVGAQAAAFTGFTVDGQLGQGVPPPYFIAVAHYRVFKLMRQQGFNERTERMQNRGLSDRPLTPSVSKKDEYGKTEG